ncbi:Uncharacterized protein Rs2_02308 [Raphanus sativus]|nr:Uncharacterized protein Rs2_02308 [Raphanus sativus]
MSEREASLSRREEIVAGAENRTHRRKRGSPTSFQVKVDAVKIETQPPETSGTSYHDHQNPPPTTILGVKDSDRHHSEGIPLHTARIFSGEAEAGDHHRRLYGPVPESNAGHPSSGGCDAGEEKGTTEEKTITALFSWNRRKTKGEGIRVTLLR